MPKKQPKNDEQAVRRRAFIQQLNLETGLRCHECQEFCPAAKLDLKKIKCQMSTWRPLNRQHMEKLEQVFAAWEQDQSLGPKLRQAFPSGILCPMIAEEEFNEYLDKLPPASPVDKPTNGQLPTVILLQDLGLVLKRLDSAEATLAELVEFLQVQSSLALADVAPPLYGCVYVGTVPSQNQALPDLAHDQEVEHLYTAMPLVVGKEDGGAMDLTDIFDEIEDMEEDEQNRFLQMFGEFVDKLSAALETLALIFSDWKPGNIVYDREKQRLLVIDLEPKYCVQLALSDIGELALSDVGASRDKVFVSNMLSMIANACRNVPAKFIKKLLDKLYNRLTADGTQARNDALLRAAAEWWHSLLTTVPAAPPRGEPVRGPCSMALHYLEEKPDLEISAGGRWPAFTSSVLVQEQAYNPHYAQAPSYEVQTETWAEVYLDTIAVEDVVQFVFFLLRLAQQRVDSAGRPP